ncbi:hypothetical protein OPQ81_002710 [Rhizoctonia solani]|nr:hypothetical protein OPQ81_002710 [Rhizoctonia solani]
MSSVPQVSNSTSTLSPLHLDAMHSSFHLPSMFDLYLFHFKHADADQYGLYNSPNILERKFYLGAEIFSECYKEGGVVKDHFYLTDTASPALSDALHQVHKVVAKYVNYPDFEFQFAGSQNSPLYHHFEDMGIAYPEEPKHIDYNYMIVTYWSTLHEVQDYVAECQVWAMFMISALHLIGMANEDNLQEVSKIPSPFHDHLHIASHLLHDRDEEIARATSFSAPPAPAPSLASPAPTEEIKESLHTATSQEENPEIDTEEALAHWYAGESMTLKSVLYGKFTEYALDYAESEY